MERKKRSVDSLGSQEEPKGSKEAGGDLGAQEIFQMCDTEGKGFIARGDLQRLHGDLSLTLEELENVFDALDADGNDALTLEEFTTGFSQFLHRETTSTLEMQGCETEKAFQSQWNKISTESMEEEELFSDLMQRLGENNVLEDENDVKQLWLHLKKEEPHLLSSFEELLARFFSQLHEADNEKNELEHALKRKIAAYDEEIKHLYEEMEQQIKNEKEKFLLKDTERYHSRSQDLEHRLVKKEQELEQLAHKQKQLEEKCKELHSDKDETRVENTQLKLANKELLSELERATQELVSAQQQLQMLQEEARKLQEEKEIEVYTVTETLQREKSALLKQLDFLRERNKYLKDERDICLQKYKTASTATRKERSGSIIGKYIERKVSLKSQSSEDDDAFSILRSRNSFGLNSNPILYEGLAQKKRLQRIISIEEDHLPQLLEKAGESLLMKWPEKDENIFPEKEMDVTQKTPVSDHTPSSPREEPVGKETLLNDERVHFAPKGLFKIVFVGNSSVGKTSFLRRFCEDRFSPGTSATVGIDYSVKTVTVDNSQVVLQLWDTAGQERYHSITKQFFRKADGIIVMYDITAKETFTAVKQWLVSIEEATGEKIPVLLLGNKTDNEKEREVRKGLGEHLAKDYNLIFYECSALSGDNTTESVLHLARVLKQQEEKVKGRTIQLHQISRKKPCCSKQ